MGYMVGSSQLQAVGGGNTAEQDHAQSYGRRHPGGDGGGPGRGEDAGGGRERGKPCPDVTAGPLGGRRFPAAQPSQQRVPQSASIPPGASCGATPAMR
jgi:hypothetical protein